MKGADLATAQRRLGYSNTLNTYAHMVPGAEENAAFVMDEITTLVTLPDDFIAPEKRPTG